jgi:hypothetical protein
MEHSGKIETRGEMVSFGGLEPFFAPPASVLSERKGTTKLNWRSSPHNQADDEQDQENHEQDPCNLSCRAGNTAKAQDPGNKRDHQKSYGPT